MYINGDWADAGKLVLMSPFLLMARFWIESLMVIGKQQEGIMEYLETKPGGISI